MSGAFGTITAPAALLTILQTKLDSLYASLIRGPVAKATLGNASALTTDANGDLYIADGPRIRKITWSTGVISGLPEGAGTAGMTSTGTRLDTRLDTPFDTSGVR